MTGDLIRDLLQPLVGKSGSLSLIVSRIGHIGIAATENKKLTGVELRDDGLIRRERESGWTVLDPSEVVAVAWTREEAESSPGLFL